MFRRILGRVSALVALGIFVHISSALPEYRVAAQTAPPGNGVATFTPGSLDFGAVQFQTASATQQITLSNTGTGPLGSIAIAVTNSDYAITATTCGTTLAVNASCVITVSLTPSFEAPDPGGIVVTDDGATTTTTGFLTGTGVGPLYVLPFQMVFNGQAVGTASPAQQAVFTNTADGAQGIDTLTTVGNAATDFTFTQNCDLTIPAGGTCPVNVVFTPSTTGPRTADLEAATNNGTIVSHLTGNGAIRHLQGFTANIIPPNDDGSSPQVPLPFSINFFGATFSSLFVNNNGNVTFTEPLSDFTPTGLTTNNGNIPIIAAYWADVDTSGAVPGDEADAGSPPSAVVTYGVDTVNGHPAFGVDYENVGYFGSHTNKLNSFQLILIDRSDTGVVGAFDIEFNYDKVQWESGDASGGVDGLCGPQTTDCVPAAVGYSNGTGDTGTNFQLPGSFVVGALLDNGPIATSLIHQALNGTVVGRTTFQVRNGTVQSADLALTMTQAAATVPAGSQQTYTVTITNAGPNDATNVIVMNTLPNQSTLVSATPSQGAACTGTLTLTCNLGTVANGGSATLTIIVSIVPDGVGTITNSATVTSDLPDPNMGNNTASETTTIGTATNFAIAPATLRFAAQALGTTSAPQTVTVTNNGTASASLTGFSISANFGVVGDGGGTCTATTTLAGGASCTFQITFGPTATGALAGAFTVTDSVTGSSPLMVALSGTGTGGAGTIVLTPTSLAFGSQPVGTTSSAQTVTVSNTGTTVVTFSSIGVTPGFGLAGTSATPGICNAETPTIPAGGSCTIPVQFAPTATGNVTGTLTVVDNAAGGQQTVALSGTGVNSSVIISVPSGGSTTATTTPGGTAFFGLQISGGTGVTGTVQLGCSSPSSFITCTVIPSTITLNGGTTEVAFGIQTFCQGSTTAVGFVPGGFGGGISFGFMALLLAGISGMFGKNRRVAVAFAMIMIVMALGAGSCASLPKGTGGATPAGTYSITLTTTLKGNTQTLPNFLTLVVK